FFSSRRRHTRLVSDWSSDVCSSDLHPDFAVDSAYDVYELDSLDAFSQDVRETLANRVAGRVVRSIGQIKPDGTRTPALLVFDERSEEHTSELQSLTNLVCRLLLSTT